MDSDTVLLDRLLIATVLQSPSPLDEELFHEYVKLDDRKPSFGSQVRVVRKACEIASSINL